MSKYKTITEDIETVTNKEVVKQNRVSLVALGLVVAAVLCVAGGWAIEDPNSSLSTFLFTEAVFLFLGGIVKFFMGRECYLFRPTGSHLQKITVYFDAKESQPLQYCIEEKRFEDLKQLKRQINTGVKLDVMLTGDKKFAAVQLSEYVPYAYEAISPVICYYGEEAKNFSHYLGNGR